MDDAVYYSYIDNHFFIIFNDSTNYIIKNPESDDRKIFTADIVNHNNFHIISEKKPPYFLFTQD